MNCACTTWPGHPCASPPDPDPDSSASDGLCSPCRYWATATLPARHAERLSHGLDVSDNIHMNVCEVSASARRAYKKKVKGATPWRSTTPK